MIHPKITFAHFFQNFMTLYQKVKKVQTLFNQLEAEINSFSQTTGLRCIMSCGRCCIKPNIEASVLEFLPLAMDYYLQGRAEEMLQKLSEPNATCHVYTPLHIELGLGSCANYAYRGLICRLFGMSLSQRQGGALQLYTCKTIKETQQEEFERTTLMVNQTRKGPMVGYYYQQLTNIDPQLANLYYPINEATKKALELVLHYYAYRRPPRGLKKAG